mmetsp:Transcript_747/g.782  ORF Transcript_747/g.782 Transcript_747/m.782 type:complete len:127 (+) Transcript_747:46-426(+)
MSEICQFYQSIQLDSFYTHTKINSLNLQSFIFIMLIFLLEFFPDSFLVRIPQNFAYEPTLISFRSPSIEDSLLPRDQTKEKRSKGEQKNCFKRYKPQNEGVKQNRERRMKKEGGDFLLYRRKEGHN